MGLELLASTGSNISILSNISTLFTTLFTTHNLPDHKPAQSSTATQSPRTFYKGLCEVYRFKYLHIIFYLHRVSHPKSSFICRQLFP